MPSSTGMQAEDSQRDLLNKLGREMEHLRRMEALQAMCASSAAATATSVQDALRQRREDEQRHLEEEARRQAQDLRRRMQLEQEANARAERELRAKAVAEEAERLLRQAELEETRLRMERAQAEVDAKAERKATEEEEARKKRQESLERKCRERDEAKKSMREKILSKFTGAGSVQESKPANSRPKKEAAVKNDIVRIFEEKATAEKIQDEVSRAMVKKRKGAPWKMPKKSSSRDLVRKPAEKPPPPPAATTTPASEAIRNYFLSQILFDGKEEVSSSEKARPEVVDSQADAEIEARQKLFETFRKGVEGCLDLLGGKARAKKSKAKAPPSQLPSAFRVDSIKSRFETGQELEAPRARRTAQKLDLDSILNEWQQKEPGSDSRSHVKPIVIDKDAFSRTMLKFEQHRAEEEERLRRAEQIAARRRELAQRRVEQAASRAARTSSSDSEDSYEDLAEEDIFLEQEIEEDDASEVDEVIAPLKNKTDDSKSERFSRSVSCAAVFSLPEKTTQTAKKTPKKGEKPSISAKGAAHQAQDDQPAKVPRVRKLAQKLKSFNDLYIVPRKAIKPAWLAETALNTEGSVNGRNGDNNALLRSCSDLRLMLVRNLERDNDKKEISEKPRPRPRGRHGQVRDVVESLSTDHRSREGEDISGRPRERSEAVASLAQKLQENQPADSVRRFKSLNSLGRANKEHVSKLQQLLFPSIGEESECEEPFTKPIQTRDRVPALRRLHSLCELPNASPDPSVKGPKKTLQLWEQFRQQSQDSCNFPEKVPRRNTGPLRRQTSAPNADSNMSQTYSVEVKPDPSRHILQLGKSLFDIKRSAQTEDKTHNVRKLSRGVIKRLEGDDENRAARYSSCDNFKVKESKSASVLQLCQKLWHQDDTPVVENRSKLAVKSGMAKRMAEHFQCQEKPTPPLKGNKPLKVQKLREVAVINHTERRPQSSLEDKARSGSILKLCQKLWQKEERSADASSNSRPNSGAAKRMAEQLAVSNSPPACSRTPLPSTRQRTFQLREELWPREQDGRQGLDLDGRTEARRALLSSERRSRFESCGNLFAGIEEPTPPSRRAVDTGLVRRMSESVANMSTCLCEKIARPPRSSAMIQEAKRALLLSNTEQRPEKQPPSQNGAPVGRLKKALFARSVSHQEETRRPMSTREQRRPRSPREQRRDSLEQRWSRCLETRREDCDAAGLAPRPVRRTRSLFNLMNGDGGEAAAGSRGLPAERPSLLRRTDTSTNALHEFEPEVVHHLRANNAAVKAMFEAQAPKYTFGRSMSDVGATSDRRRASGPVTRRSARATESRNWVLSAINKHFNVIVEKAEEEAGSDCNLNQTAVTYPDSDDEDARRPGNVQAFKSSTNIRALMQNAIEEASENVGVSQNVLLENLKRNLALKLGT